ncbi:MAG: hypothetical protein ACREQA_19730 [Candidatus Binatia bacterium]
MATDPALPWTAFEEVTADELNKRRPIWVVKSLSESVTSSTALQNDDELFVTLPASSRWHVRLRAMFDTNGSATPDIKTDWTIPADATLVSLKWVLGPDSGSTSRDNTNVRQGVYSHTSAIAYGSGEVSADLWINIEEEFIIDIVTEGAVQFRWAQNTSNATATEIRAGSFIRAERIS